MFSIKFLLELFAAARVKREGRKNHDDNSDVNDIKHKFSKDNAAATTQQLCHSLFMGELKSH